jgi:hypothetical protein
MSKDEIRCEDGRRCVRGVVSYGKGAEFRRCVGERAVRRTTGAMTLAVLISSALLWSRGCASPPHAVVQLNTTNFDVLTETPMFVKVRRSRMHTYIYADALANPESKIVHMHLTVEMSHGPMPLMRYVTVFRAVVFTLQHDGTRLQQPCSHSTRGVAGRQGCRRQL